MFPSNLFHLLLSASLAATAVALPASATAPRVLGENDLIILGANGHTEIMHKDVYYNLTLGGKTLHHPGPLASPAELAATTKTYHAQDGPAKIKRRCQDFDLYVLDSQAEFNDWDVPMSGVVFANGNVTTVLVTNGYSVSDAIAVSAELEGSVEDFLSVTVGITYTHTWTTTTTAGYSYSVPPGKYGAIVSNPRTHRCYGHIDSGCIGTPDSTTTFMADNRFSQDYGGLTWVEGVIKLCTGDTYPLHKCHGEGYLY